MGRDHEGDDPAETASADGIVSVCLGLSGVRGRTSKSAGGGSTPPGATHTTQDRRNVATRADSPREGERSAVTTVEEIVLPEANADLLETWAA
jgi:hypothetical protein